MRVSLTTNDFEKQILNIANYSIGFLDGVNKGKKIFLDNMGKGVIYTLGRYIDVEAKANSSAFTMFMNGIKLAARQQDYLILTIP